MIKEITNIYKKYNGKRLADNGSVVSKEYKSFQNAFVRTLRAIAEIEDANVAKVTNGHYFVSAFIERNGKYVYIYYGCPDRTFIDFDGAKRALYYRSAKSDNDFTGGINRYCALEKLPYCINELLTDGRIL